MDWPDTSFELDTTTIAGSDQARLRVMATDGVNTDQATSAAFQVERKGPRLVAILMPEDGQMYAPDELVELQGPAWDEEDGNLSDAALTWTDNISGTLGTGEWLYVPSLSPGWHTITLTATDSDGMVGTDAIHIFIGQPFYLPLLLHTQ